MQTNETQVQQKRHKMMTEMPVSKLIPKLAVPTIISMLITALYNMADTYFVSSLSTDAAAAVGVVFSLMSLIQAVGFMMGMGSGNFVSQLLGRKDYDTAEKTVSVAFFTTFFAGIIMCVGGILNVDSLVRLLGAIESVHPYAMDYAVYILLAAPFMMGSFVLNNQLRAQGSAVLSMIGITTGGLLNVVLDPIFIFAMDMGISGAAIATMLSQMTSFMILLILINKTPATIGVNIKKFRPSFYIYKEIVHIGLPSLCRQGLASLSSVVLNLVAGQFSSAVMAAMTITNKFMMMIFSALIGFAQGFQPVCGFNYGAKRYDRVREAYRFSVKVAVILLTVLGTVAFVFAPHILGIFESDSKTVVEVGAKALRIQCLTLPLQAYAMMSQFLAQSIGFGGRASIVAMARQGLFLIPAYLTLPKLAGVTGLQMSQASSDALTFILTLFLSSGIMKSLNGKNVDGK